MSPYKKCTLTSATFDVLEQRSPDFRRNRRMSPYKNVYPNICYFRFWESKRSSDFKRNRRMSPALFWFQAPRTVVSSQLCKPNFSIGILQWQSQSCTGQVHNCCCQVGSEPDFAGLARFTVTVKPAQKKSLHSWRLLLPPSLPRTNLC